MQANRQITREFDTLRLCIREHDGLPEQVVLPEYPGELQYLDFSDEPAPRAAAERWVGDQLGKRENLHDGPLWFCVVFRLGQDHHLWVQYTSHLVMDGFTGTMLAQRLASLYNAYVSGQEPEPAAYGSVLELVTLEQEYRASDRYRRDREYWMQHLSNVPPAVTLAKPGEQHSAGLLRATGEFSPETVLRLRALGEAHGASLPQTLIALIAAYYHRYTGAEDLVMAMPVTGRVGARYRQVPGLAANAIYLRLAMRPSQPFYALFPHVSSVVRHGLRHQQYRVEDVRRDLGMFANMQRIARLAVNIEAFDYGLHFGQAQAVPHNLCNGLADDLTIFCYERGNGMALRFDLDANPALYDREELAEHCRRLILLADSILEAPERPLGGLLDIMGTQERCRLLWECNATAMPLPAMSTLPHQLLERHASIPAGIVVQCDERTLDDAQVCELAARMAARWIADGIKPGDVIAVALPRSEQLLLVLLAVMWSGAAYLPLDPDGPLLRNRHMLDDAAAIGLVCEPVLRDTLLLDAMVWLDPCPADLPAPIAPLATPEGTAYVLYTSGSTGAPKGVEISHRSLLNFLFAMRHELGLRPRDRVLAVTTVTFDIAGLELYLPLLVGARVVIAQGAITQDPRGLARLIAQAQVNVIQATPSLWRILLANDDLPLDKVHALVGGEALGTELATRLLARVGRLTQMYGPTETTIWSTIMPLQLTDAPRPPIGRPIANTWVYVLDPQQQLLPTGAVGELYIGGAGVAKGYRGKPQLTSERFVPDPFVADGSRMYRTGDQVRLRPDGVLEFIGRIDDQLKIRGHRIEPREIEEALQRHPQVAQAVVVGHRDHDETMQLLAYVVALPEQSVDVDALRQYLQACLPSAMLPSRWMSLPALPLTTTGKLDRKALPAPDAPPPREHVPPRDPIEQQLATMVEDILGISGVGVHDSFLSTLPHQLLERHASIPAGIVVQCDERTLDDAQVCELAARMAARWIADGIKPGDVIAVALPRSEQLLLVLLAVMWSGAAYLPLDPDGPLLRNRHMLDDAAAIGLVCEPVLRDTLLLDAMVWLDPCPADLPAPIAPLATPEGTAYVLYTSGSTGAPKGVEISHRSLLNFLFAMRHELGLRPRDRVLAVTTVTFDIAGLELYLPLLVGARVVIAQGAITQDPRGLARLIAQAQVNVIQATPSLWRILLANDDLPLDKVHALVGGEALGTELATRLLARVGRLTQMYGPTETTIWSTIMPLQLTDAPRPPIGRPIANTWVYVLDPQQQLLPTGAVGELYIGGAGVAKGYRGKPQLTSERFVPDPFVADGSRMYRTGDQVRLRPDGVLEFIGRIDDQLKIRGHRIEPREIEEALQRHPQVAQAVVVGHRDHDETMQLLAYVVALPEQSVDVDALRQYLQACLPSAMLPSRWMSLPALPLTTTGKLDRKALPAPDAPPPREHVPPRDPIEQQLATMVEDILGISGVGVHDSFFELGVDSLGAAQMAARFPQVFGIELPLVTLLNEPTIAGLAEVIRRNAQLHSDPLASVLTLREGEVGTPALFCIHPVMGMSWSYATLLSQLDPRWPVVLLQSPGLADSSYRPDSIEAIARDYLARMRSVQPHGPYRLVGWSLGGLIAHAIAAELRAVGESVELLALLDSYPLAPQDAQADEIISITTALRVLDVELAPGTPLPTTMAELAKVLCDHYGLLSFPLARQLLEQQHDLVLNIGELIQHHLHLACHHRPTAIDVDVLFVEATRRPDVGMDATDLIDHHPQRWQELVRSLHVEAFDTDHYGILSLAHVGRLAKLLHASVAQPATRAVLAPGPVSTPTSDGVVEHV